MTWESFGISVILVAALTVAAAIERAQYTRKALRRLHEKGLRADALRPRPRRWYRLRSGFVLFVIVIASYLLIRWAFPDDPFFSVGAFPAAVILGCLALLGSVLYGMWLGDLWFDIADATYRAAKAEEKGAQSPDGESRR
jgi:polyferredoxin